MSVMLEMSAVNVNEFSLELGGNKDSQNKSKRTQYKRNIQESQSS